MPAMKKSLLFLVWGRVFSAFERAVLLEGVWIVSSLAGFWGALFCFKSFFLTP
jgi:hypothetical protein